MNGESLLGTGTLPAVADTNWHIQAVADFDRDGDPDLVWRHRQTGGNAVWVLGAPGDSPQPMALPGLTDLSWRLGAVGDFTGDGHADLVWQSSVTGAVAIWKMQGAVYAGSHIVQAAAEEWSIAGTGDYNSDGDLDLVWRNGMTGGAAYWYLGLPAGTFLDPGSFPGVTHDLSWQIVGPR